MTDATYYWHDYETFGTHPACDRPAQFAGIRTDADFNIIEPPLVVYCRLAADSLPHPDACLLTGITPQLVDQQGVCEAEFIRLIHEQLVRPNTCTLGYNNIRFDDEVTRNLLYRNFYDPYAREWQNGNSRWDLLDVVRAASALRPTGIVWPTSAQQSENAPKPSFKLEHLTNANGIGHAMAHDALSDVEATIAIARLLRQAQPKLYQFLSLHRQKTAALELLQLGRFKPIVHVSGKYAAAKHCLAVVLPLCKHPTNTNGIIVFDLSFDSEPLLTLSVEMIRQRLFTATCDLPDGVERIPLKTVHINKCPVLAPINVIRPDDAVRLNLDLERCYANIDKIKASTDLSQKLAAVFTPAPSTETMIDADLAIYAGGFFSDTDKQKMAKIRASTPQQLATIKLKFNDARLPEMLFRYRARSYPETLTDKERQRWDRFCKDRLTGKIPGAGMTFDAYFARLSELKKTESPDTDMLNALTDYALAKKQALEG